MKLQQIFFNGKIVKTASIIFLTSVVLVILLSSLEIFMKVQIPSILEWIAGAPFIVTMMGTVFVGGPIMRIMKDDLTKGDRGSEKFLMGATGVFNFCVGAVLINLLVLKPLQLGAVSQFEIPWLTVPLYLIMTIFVGNILYSKMIMEPLLKKVFK
jgi:hypothetical protein